MHKWGLGVLIFLLVCDFNTNVGFIITEEIGVSHY